MFQCINDLKLCCPIKDSSELMELVCDVNESVPRATEFDFDITVVLRNVYLIKFQAQPNVLQEGKTFL
jgi:hypothetical protein